MTPLESPRHVVLVGMMGSGKTSVGRRLARELDRPFVDSDEGYIARFNTTVADTFASAGGEALFRSRELELLGALVAVREPLVIACGGGIVTTANARAVLKSDRVHCVYLRCQIEFLVDKLAARAHRPLLANGDPAETMKNIWAQRRDLYEDVADTIVDVDDLLKRGYSKRKIARFIAAL